MTQEKLVPETMVDLAALQSAAKANGLGRNLWTGFNEADVLSEESQKVVRAKIKHLRSEVEEVLEAYENKDFENFREEITDVFMVSFGICAMLGLNITKADFVNNIAKNEYRVLHGKEK